MAGNVKGVCEAAILMRRVFTLPLLLVIVLPLKDSTGVAVLQTLCCVP